LSPSPRYSCGYREEEEEEQEEEEQEEQEQEQEEEEDFRIGIKVLCEGAHPLCGA